MKKIILVVCVFIFSCKAEKRDNVEENKEKIVTIAVGSDFILIEDKSFLLKDFEMGYLNKHNEKLKSIYPDTVYNVQLEVGEGTKLDRIMLVKNVLKKHHVKKINIKIRK